MDTSPPAGPSSNLDTARSWAIPPAVTGRGNSSSFLHADPASRPNQSVWSSIIDQAQVKEQAVRRSLVSAQTPQHACGVSSAFPQRKNNSIMALRTVAGPEERMMSPQNSWGTDQACSKPGPWVCACTLEKGSDGVRNLGPFLRFAGSVT